MLLGAVGIAVRWGRWGGMLRAGGGGGMVSEEVCAGVQIRGYLVGLEWEISLRRGR